MKIEPLSLTVRELREGYADHDVDGGVAYGGKLDVRTCNLMKGNV